MKECKRMRLRFEKSTVMEEEEKEEGVIVMDSVERGGVYQCNEPADLPFPEPSDSLRC